MWSIGSSVELLGCLVRDLPPEARSVRPHTPRPHDPHARSASLLPVSDEKSNPTLDDIQSRSRQQGGLPLSSPIRSTVRQEHRSQGELIRLAIQYQ